MIYVNPSITDLVDKNASIVLAVTLLPAVVLPALHLKHDYLLVAVMLNHGAGNTGAIHDGAANLNVGSLTHEEYSIEIHLLTYSGGELFNLDDITLINAILLAACFYDCVHDFQPPFIAAKVASLIGTGLFTRRGVYCQ
jgi:hypothetical protein